VISKALRVWNLDSVPLSSPAMKQTMEDPTRESAAVTVFPGVTPVLREVHSQFIHPNKPPEFSSSEEPAMEVDR